MNLHRQINPRQRGLRILALLLSGILFSGGVSDGREPTELEQYMLELLNRARADPGAEVTRLSGEPWGGTPDLNEGPPFIPLVDQAYQPLAFNLDLIDSASGYADLLTSTGGSGHFVGGTTPQQRAEAEGYVFLPAPSGIQEGIAQTETALPFATTADVDNHWQQFFINASVFGRIDRVKMLSAEYNEIGIGITHGTIGPTDGDTPYDVTTVADLAYTTNDPFITGVFFDDQTGDDFYTPFAGEALGGVSVDVYNAGTTTLVTSFTTWGSGGYSVQLATGNYDFVVHDLVAGDRFLNDLNLGSENLKVDYNRALIPEPAALALMLLGAAFPLLRRRRT